MRPGSTVCRDRSTTSAPAGMGRSGPTAVMRSPVIRMTALATGGPPRPSSSRPARAATVRGGVGGSAPAAPSGERGGRTSARQDRIRRPRGIGHLVRQRGPEARSAYSSGTRGIALALHLWLKILFEERAWPSPPPPPTLHPPPPPRRRTRPTSPP